MLKEDLIIQDKFISLMIVMKITILILKSQPRFRTPYIHIQWIHSITLIANYDKRIQSIDYIDTYTYGTRKDIIQKNNEVKIQQFNKTIQKWSTLINLMLQEKT